MDAHTLELRVASLLADGDLNTAVTAALAALGPKLRGFIRAAVLNPAAADDIWADTSVAIYRGLHGWDQSRPLFAWCLGVARNACRNHIRRARDHARPKWAFSHTTAARTPTPTWQTTPLRASIQALRESLTLEERMLLILRVDKDLPWADVARVMHPDITDPAALARRAAALRKRFERTVDRLRHLARRAGLIDPPAQAEHAETTAPPAKTAR